MAFPYTQYNSLRCYDRAVATWINSLPVDYGDIAGTAQRDRGLLWVYASPTKALASMHKVLTRKGWISPSDVGADGMDAEHWLTVPLPFASIQRGDLNWDSMRARIPFKFRKFIREGATFKAARYPLPYDITYTVEFWTRRTFTYAYIAEWLAVQVGPVGAANNEMFLSVPFGDPWGTKIIPVQGISLTDNSDLEPGEEADRDLRLTLSFTLKAWVFPPVEQAVPMVLRVITDIGPQSRIDSEDFESMYDRQIFQDYDAAEKVAHHDSVFFEVSTGVSQVGDATWDIPTGGFIQTVDVPVFGGEGVFLYVDTVSSIPLPNGLQVDIEDYNRDPVQSFVVYGGTEHAHGFWTVLDDYTNAVRLRLAPTEACELTVNDVQVRNVTYQQEAQANEFPEGDMESGNTVDWLPVVGSGTLPATLAWDTVEKYAGSRSLQVAASAQDAGMERSITVPKGKLFVIDLRLRGSGGAIELSLVDDGPLSYAMETRLTVQPTSSWSRYALVLQPRTSTLTFRARQATSAGVTFNVDALTVKQLTPVVSGPRELVDLVQ